MSCRNSSMSCAARCRSWVRGLPSPTKPRCTTCGTAAALFEGKPGITGLWQVKGRSRVTFDEMVRLDIQYLRNWSLGLDLKILLDTPRAVLFGKGAQ